MNKRDFLDRLSLVGRPEIIYIFYLGQIVITHLKNLVGIKKIIF